MKPTKLTIEGLNSFLEKQTIDFEELGKEKIFGIFGPTGSGKSTVLDAITFALYGRIARESSAKTTADAINIHAASAKVVFEFEVNGKAKNTYKVLREIKRKEPAGIQTTQIKLYEVAEEDKILAEKEKEFNAALGTIIGLEYEDFVKTVVLPQGGFNEFLRMEGKDRRVVLERLFNLEKYGDELSRKVNGRHAEKNSEKTAVEGELKAYEDLSDEGLKQEQAAILEQEAALRKLSEESRASDQETEKAKEKYSLQLELEQSKKEVQREEAKAESIEKLRLQIQNSQKYQMVESQTSEYKSIVEEGKAKAKESKAIQEECLRLEKQREEIKINLEKADSLQKEHYPKLLQKQEQLKNAIEGYGKYQAEKAKAKELEASLESLSKAESKAAEEAEKIRQAMEKAEVFILKEKEILAERSGIQSQKDNLSQAVAIFGKISELKAHRETLQKNAAALREACQQMLDLGEEPRMAEGYESQLLKIRLEIEHTEASLSHLAEELESQSISQGLSPKELLEELDKAEQFEKEQKERIQSAEKELAASRAKEEAQRAKIQGFQLQRAKLEAEDEQNKKSAAYEKEKLEKLLGTAMDPGPEIKKIEGELKQIAEFCEAAKKQAAEFDQKYNQAQTGKALAENELKALKEKVVKVQEALYQKLEQMEVEKFSELPLAERSKHLLSLIPVLESWSLSGPDILQKEEVIKTHRRILDELKGKIRDLEKKAGQDPLSQAEYQQIIDKNGKIRQELEKAKEQGTAMNVAYKNNLKRYERAKVLLQKKKELDRELALVGELKSLFSGRKFVEFMAINQLKYVTLEATHMLDAITNGNYALEVDENGTFKIRDNKNGGIQRNVKSLSGGETFLVSLSLALALSAQIQLKGVAPLELFFLDEGFGTLDDDLLEVVMDALENIKSERLNIGLISHVEQLKQRIPVRLSVLPAKSGEGGTKVKIERN